MRGLKQTGSLFKVSRSHPQATVGFLIFAACLFIDLMNPQMVIIGDTLPNSLLAMNWLRNGTLNFDACRANFEPGELPWYFVEAPNGHLTSVYPIGTAIVTFPFYVLFSLYLKIVGIFCGPLPGIRPTSMLFAIALLIYCLFTYRKDFLFVLLGLPSALLTVGWNYYFFGSIIGGCSQQFATRQSSYEFSLPFFWNAFWGLLISPSRSILIYSPILLFAIPGLIYVYRARTGKDEKLLVCLAIAVHSPR